MMKFVIAFLAAATMSSAQAKVCSPIELTQALHDKIFAAVHLHCAALPELFPIAIDESTLQDCQTAVGASDHEYTAVVNIRSNSRTDTGNWQPVEVSVPEGPGQSLPIVVRGEDCIY